MLQNVEISNISTYGVRAIFYMNIDDAPRTRMYANFEEGTSQLPYKFSMTYAGDYTVTGSVSFYFTNIFLHSSAY